MFGLGYQELLLILVIVLILFGAQRLPDLARSLGSSVKEFKKGVAELKDEYGTVSDEQQAWLDWFRAIPGVEVFTWRPRDSDSVTRILAA